MKSNFFTQNPMNPWNSGGLLKLGGLTDFAPLKRIKRYWVQETDAEIEKKHPWSYSIAEGHKGPYVHLPPSISYVLIFLIRLKENARYCLPFFCLCCPLSTPRCSLSLWCSILHASVLSETIRRTLCQQNVDYYWVEFKGKIFQL